MQRHVCLLQQYTCVSACLETVLNGSNFTCSYVCYAGLLAGMPGMPTMTQEEMLAATLAGSGPKKVSKGKVRRKKGQTRGLAELAGLRS